jgi:hypothetical protein
MQDAGADALEPVWREDMNMARLDFRLIACWRGVHVRVLGESIRHQAFVDRIVVLNSDGFHSGLVRHAFEMSAERL